MDMTPHLEWPFFEERHRTLVASLAGWIRERHDFEDAEKLGEEEATRVIDGELGKGGWLAHLVPTRYGGVADRIDVRTLCLIREMLASRSGLADCAFAMQGLGSAPITLFGTEAQKQHYLPGVAKGTRIAAFALSEPETGSDVAALSCAARREGDHYIIDGEKTWISNAGVANHYIVFLRTGEAPGVKGLSALVVDADTPGLTITDRLEITAPHVIGTLRFKGAKVPASAVLGAPGEGFRVAMGTLDIFRPSVGAAALGFARRALAEAVERVKSRKAFGQTLAAMQGTQMRIADMAVELDAAALLVYRAAWACDCTEGRRTAESSMAKMYATESAQRIIDSAVQLFGGLGVTVGQTVERLYREIRPLRIYEGTTEIQKLIIASQVLGKG